MKLETMCSSPYWRSHRSLLSAVFVVLVGCGRPGLQAKSDGSAVGEAGGIGGNGASGGSMGTGGKLSTGGIGGVRGNAGSGGIWEPLTTVAGRGGAGGGSGSGGALNSMGGATGDTSATDTCGNLSYDYCVSDCLTEGALVANATCRSGVAGCRSGFILASTCPPRACGTTADACCDLDIGIVTSNPCGSEGYRGVCPVGNTMTYGREAICVPQALSDKTCYSLNGSPCTAPSMGCSDMSNGQVICSCFRIGADAPTGTWQCSSLIH